MRTQPETQQQLELAVEIANACHPESLTPADVQLGQLRAQIAMVLALQGVTAEIRETRAELVNALTNYPRWSQPVQVVSEKTSADLREFSRPDRGPVTLALLVMGCTIAALVILAIVLALS